jgi:hypothetical protein
MGWWSLTRRGGRWGPRGQCRARWRRGEGCGAVGGGQPRDPGPARAHAHLAIGWASADTNMRAVLGRGNLWSPCCSPASRAGAVPCAGSAGRGEYPASLDSLVRLIILTS